jgi:hypothetical protein
MRRADRLQRVHIVERLLPRRQASEILLEAIDRAFAELDSSTLFSLCEENLVKFLSYPAQVSNVASSVRIPLGEIDGSSMGIHVYLSEKGDEPIHSHAQNLYTFVFKGTFRDEIFNFVQDPDGPLVKHKISKAFLGGKYKLSFEREAGVAVSRSYQRLVAEREIGYLLAEEAHMVRAHSGVITLYRFSGQFRDSGTFLPREMLSPFVFGQTTEAKTKMIANARMILASHIAH